jgi:cytochrome P450
MPGQRESVDRFAYLPFGAGPRVCIGMGFALQEAIIILAMILREYQPDLVPGHKVTPIQRITLRPQGGMPMLLQRRVRT